jgi:urocanate hydratase
MLRASREFRWACRCCSIDSDRSRVSKRIMEHMARRREERRWVREAREERRDAQA